MSLQFRQHLAGTAFLFSLLGIMGQLKGLGLESSAVTFPHSSSDWCHYPLRLHLSLGLEHLPLVFPCDCFLPAWWLSSRSKGPKRKRSRWRNLPYLSNHIMLLSTSSLVMVVTEFCQVQGKGTQILCLMNQCQHHVLRRACGIDVLVQSSLEKIIFHSLCFIKNLELSIN